MQAAGLDVSRTSLVVSRQCITRGTGPVYTAGSLVGCFPRLSGDAERKRSFVGVDSEKERRSPVDRAFRSCYDRILFDSRLLTDLVAKSCHCDTFNLDFNRLEIRCDARTLNIEAYDNNITRVANNKISDVGSVVG